MRLATKVIAGGVVYGAVVLALYRDRLRALLSMLRQSRTGSVVVKVAA